MSLDGSVNLTLSNKSAGIFDQFSNSIKPFQLLNSSIQLAGPAKLPQGFSELAFEFPLTCSKESKILYETYHGIFVNINYMIKCDIKRSFLAKSVQKSQQFVIQYKPTALVAPSEVNFTISPETLQKSGKERISIPRFLITGYLDSVDCCITKPFTGHVIFSNHSPNTWMLIGWLTFQLTVQHTEAAIKSIDLQLVRIETCGSTEGFSRDGNFCFEILTRFKI